MNKENTKRNRSVNWDEEEKQLLRNILKDFSQIIEDKSLNTNTNKNKTKAWEAVHKRFNELNCRKRDLAQLKIQWKGMKVNARKTYSTYKKETLKTGGGARPGTPDDSVIEVKDLLNPAELLRDDNPFDSDGLDLTTYEVKKPATDVVVFDMTECEQKFDVDLTATPPLQTNMGNVIATKHEFYGDPMEDTVMSSTHTSLHEEKKLKKPNRQQQIKNSNVAKNAVKDYKTQLIKHSEELKNEEHRMRMKMAAEEHEINMQIAREKLETARMEKEIWKLKLEKERGGC